MRAREMRVDADGQGLFRCTRCDIWQPVANFYRSRGRAQSECKPCHQRTSIETRNADRHREYNRLWMRDSGYGQRPEVLARERSRARAKNGTLEARVRALVHRAISLRLLAVADACARCGLAGGVNAHHKDYTKPLEVEWLCTGCHGVEHRKRVAP